MKVFIKVYDNKTRKFVPVRLIILKNNKSLYNWYDGFDGIYINGEKIFSLEKGEYDIIISGGNEYKSIKKRIKIVKSNSKYIFYLERLINMKEIGWWTGEGHSHIFRGRHIV